MYEIPAWDQNDDDFRTPLDNNVEVEDNHNNNSPSRDRLIPVQASFAVSAELPVMKQYAVQSTLPVTATSNTADYSVPANDNSIPDDNFSVWSNEFRVTTVSTVRHGNTTPRDSFSSLKKAVGEKTSMALPLVDNRHNYTPIKTNQKFGFVNNILGSTYGNSEQKPAYRNNEHESSYLFNEQMPPLNNDQKPLFVNNEKKLTDVLSEEEPVFVDTNQESTFVDSEQDPTLVNTLLDSDAESRPLNSNLNSADDEEDTSNADNELDSVFVKIKNQDLIGQAQLKLPTKEKSFSSSSLAFGSSVSSSSASSPSDSSSLAYSFQTASPSVSSFSASSSSASGSSAASPSASSASFLRGGHTDNNIPVYLAERPLSWDTDLRVPVWRTPASSQDAFPKPQNEAAAVENASGSQTTETPLIIGLRQPSGDEIFGRFPTSKPSGELSANSPSSDSLPVSSIASGRLRASLISTGSSSLPISSTSSGSLHVGSLPLGTISYESLPVSSISSSSLPFSSISSSSPPIGSISSSSLPISSISSGSLPVSSISSNYIPVSGLSSNRLPVSIMSSSRLPISGQSSNAVGGLSTGDMTSIHPQLSVEGNPLFYSDVQNWEMAAWDGPEAVQRPVAVQRPAVVFSSSGNDVESAWINESSPPVGNVAGQANEVGSEIFSSSWTINR